MFPNMSSKLIGKTPHKQQGFLLPLALFIIVVLGGTAVIVSQKVSQSTASYILDAISTQTFYAAESGAQAGLHTLFFTDTDRQLADGRCAAMNINQLLNSDGLKNCTVVVSCACHYENGSTCDAANAANYLGISGVTNSFYVIDSQAQCGVEPTISEHRIEVGASL